VKHLDAILIPGGGLRAGGLPPWTVNRLEKAVEIARECLTLQPAIVTLSAATPHRPLPLDRSGTPIYESRVAADYLLEQGYPPDRVFVETSSWDTIGNAYFARVIHTDPAGWQRLAVITSKFHLARTEAAFRWIFGAPPSEPPYDLRFIAVPDVGLDDASLAGRVKRERASLAALQENIARYSTLQQIHTWLHSKHQAYAAHLEPVRAIDQHVLGSY
jgi:uncharacterized SAM-binding protein YcdF (DUF218 family)